MDTASINSSTRNEIVSGIFLFLVFALMAVFVMSSVRHGEVPAIGARGLPSCVICGERKEVTMVMRFPGGVITVCPRHFPQGENKIIEIPIEKPKR